MTNPGYKAVLIGASAGGVEALLTILPALPADYPLPIGVVLHIPPDKESLLATIFTERCRLPAQEAEDKQTMEGGHIYFAPPNYHLLLERDGTFSLSTETPVFYSRPSIDVFFESGADAYGDAAIGIILTGGNQDGAAGLAAILASGGTGLVQDPREASVPVMPAAAVTACPTARVATLQDIVQFLQSAGGVA